MSNQEKAEQIAQKAYEQGHLTDNEFMQFMSNILISEGGYIMDWGTNAMGNAQMVLMLKKKIEKHPKLWKLFFMIA